MRFVLYPFKMGSEAGCLMAEALDALKVYPDRAYRPKPGDFIVNWGNGHRPIWANYLTDGNTLLNHWANVDLSISKIDSFTRFKKYKVPTPAWTTDKETAAKWLKDGEWVCCRQKTEAKDGAGLVLAKKPDDLVNAPLFTKYIPIAKEYRAYVVGDKMIDVLEKRRSNEAIKEGKLDADIRTESRGWVFCRSAVYPPKDLAEVSVAAIAANGLDFGGVDILLGRDGKSYVLETNTAPGIAGQTVEKFVAAFKKMAA